MFLETIGRLFTSAAPWISAGMNLLSTVKAFQGAGALEKEGRFNREVYEDEARQSWVAYEDQAAILQHQQRYFRETARTGFLKSGVEMQGSPMEVLNEIVYQQSLDQTAMYHTAQAGYRKLMNQGAMAEWQAYEQGSAIRSQALGNFGSSLLTSQLRYPAGWDKRTTDGVVAGVDSAPPAASNYTRAEANAVPGRGGVRFGRTTY